MGAQHKFFHKQSTLIGGDGGQFYPQLKKCQPGTLRCGDPQTSPTTKKGIKAKYMGSYGGGGTFTIRDGKSKTPICKVTYGPRGLQSVQSLHKNWNCKKGQGSEALRL